MTDREGGLRQAEAELDTERQKTRRGERTAPAQAPRLSEFTADWLAGFQDEAQGADA